MPRSYRGVVIAVLGCLIALYGPSGHAENATAYHNHKPANQAAAPASIGKLPAAKPYQPHCQPAGDQNETAVCAAIEQARAADRANGISVKTLFWNKVGIAAVALTLLATAWAAWAASAAAAGASESIRQFRLIERGYMVPSFDYDGVGMKVRIHNKGRTPVTVLHADIAIRPEPITGDVPIIVTVPHACDILVDKDKSYDFPNYRIPGNNRIIYLIGGVIYEDMFGKGHVCPIFCEYNRDTQSVMQPGTGNFARWHRMAGKVKRPKQND